MLATPRKDRKTAAERPTRLPPTIRTGVDSADNSLFALEEGEPLSQKELAEAARIEQPSMAELLARMERDGVVQREPNPEDKRGSLTSLTRAARARLPDAKEALWQGEDEATAELSEREKATLIKLLQKVVRNLEAADPT
jgi:DNA-binding MarR family transcriptional regulator